jgi:hypothetical protein
MDKKEDEELHLTDAEKQAKREAHQSALNAVRELPGTQSVALQFPHLVDKAVDAFLKERVLTDEEVALMGKERDLPPVPPHQMVDFLTPTLSLSHNRAPNYSLLRGSFLHPCKPSRFLTFALNLPQVGHTLGVYGPDHPLRVRCHELVESNRFLVFMMIAVIGSSIMLPLRSGATDPPDALNVWRVYGVYAPENMVETVVDVIFILIFWIEIILK